MRIGRFEIKRRVWLFLGVGGAISAAWWIWAGSVIVPPAQGTPVGPPSVRLVGTALRGEGGVVSERAVYLDPTPLFFPTEWNFGQGVLSQSLKRQPGQMFESFEAKFSSHAPTLPPRGTESAQSARQLADAVVNGNEAPFDGLGQIDVPRRSLPERGGYVEVTRLDNGTRVIEQAVGSLPVLAGDLVPMEFLVVVSAAGLVREPILTSVGTPDEAGVALKEYLSLTFHLGSKLAPGLYRVVIGP